MSITRSKSEPHSLLTAFPAPPLKHTASHADLERNHFGRAATHRTVYARSPVHSPRVEREDPFNLGTFFPATPRVSDEEERWDWLRQEEGIAEGAEEEDAENSRSQYSGNETSPPPTPGAGILGELQDEMARKAIECEDKLGVLSLETLFSMRNSQPLAVDDRLFSPYADDGAVDHDSLYMALRARRQAAQMSLAQAENAVPLGELFLPPKEKLADEKERWASSLYQGIWKAMGFEQ